MPPKANRRRRLAYVSDEGEEIAPDEDSVATVVVGVDGIEEVAYVSPRKRPPDPNAFPALPPLPSLLAVSSSVQLQPPSAQSLPLSSASTSSGAHATPTPSPIPSHPPNEHTSRQSEEDPTSGVLPKPPAKANNTIVSNQL